MPETRRRSVAADANVLVNLIHLDRLDLLDSLPDYEFVVPDIVVSEITVEEQTQRLNTALDQGDAFSEPRAIVSEREGFSIPLASSSSPFEPAK